MKKMFYVAVAIVAMSSAFSFTSCKDDNKDQNQDQQTVVDGDSLNKDSLNPAAPTDTTAEKKDATAEEAPAADAAAPATTDQKADAAPAK